MTRVAEVRPLVFFSIVSLFLLLFSLFSLQAEDLFQIVATSADIAERAREALQAGQAELENLLNERLTGPIHVYVAPTRFDFDTATFGGAPDWGIGVAIPQHGRIIILSPVNEHYGMPFEEVLLHELAHLALWQRTAGNRLPRFLDEGLAMMFAHEWRLEDEITLAKAKLGQSFLTLQEIDYVNFLNPAQAQIAYAQSFQAVKYIFDTFGKQTFWSLMDGFRAGKDRNLVFREVLGTDLAGFDKMVAAYLNSHYHWFMIFTDPTILWIGLALLFLIGFIVIRLRRKRIYKKWEEEEKLQSTDFDYEGSSKWD